jgi:hypothetical protein
MEIDLLGVKRHRTETYHSYECHYENCYKRYKYEYKLKLHLRNVHKENNYICNQCNGAYEGYINFKHHLGKCLIKDKDKILAKRLMNKTVSNQYSKSTCLTLTDKPELTNTSVDTDATYQFKLLDLLSYIQESGSDMNIFSLEDMIYNKPTNLPSFVPFTSYLLLQ